MILLDIEGTTTAIDFVHKVLFPYAAERMEAYLNEHADEASVANCMAEALETARLEGLDPDPLKLFLQWIAEDRKHPALKQIQGEIWRQGFERGEFRGHVYPDVRPAFEAWTESGLRLAIYSSGSVEAQKLFFKNSEQGDLTPFLSGYFDTRIGSKREAASYRSIADHFAVDPETILFLSDVPAELDAARGAGMRTCQIVRPGTQPTPNHPTAPSLAELPFDEGLRTVKVGAEKA